MRIIRLDKIIEIYNQWNMYGERFPQETKDFVCKFYSISESLLNVIIQKNRFIGTNNDN